MNVAREIAARLLQIKAIKLSPKQPFTWASGLKSPIYCDNRVLLSYPDIRDFVVGRLVEKATEFGTIDVVAGVATAGIPHGALIADRMGLPFIYVRSKAKEHGRQNLIEGEVTPGQTVLVVEDLISTGGSSLQAVESLKAENLNIAGVIAIFSYQFPKAQHAFAEADCKFDTLSNYQALLEVAQSQHYISEDELQALRNWSADPSAWSQSFG
jgi:orotate phosphoribosyltransferase